MLFALCLIFLYTGHANAQQATVSGQIKDKGETIPFATVALLATEDSTLLQGTTADMDGNFSLSTEPGSYLLKVQFVSYTTEFVAITLAPAETKNLGEIQMKSSEKLLEEILIEDEKELFEMTAEKRIYNVAQDMTVTGGTAADVLENVPSVTVDQDGTVSLRGSENVRIFINGRQSGLTSSADILAQIPADAIERIEIMTNPSAKYDAEGSAGILNIVLKRNSKKGIAGMLSTSAGYSPHNHNISGNLNYGKGNWRFEGGGNMRYREREGYARTDRLTFGGLEDQFLNQFRDYQRQNLSGNLNFGVEFSPSDNTTFYSRLTYQKGQDFDQNFNTYSAGIVGEDPLDLFIRNNEEDEYKSGIDYSLDWTQKFKKERQLRMNISYSNNSQDAFQRNIQAYQRTSGEISSLSDEFQNVGVLENQDNFILEANYDHPFLGDKKIETGFKSSWRELSSDYLVEDFDEEIQRFEPVASLTNEFVFEEWVNAAYATFNDKIGEKFKYQIGLRAEHTTMNSRLLTTNESYPRDYLNLFPSAFFTYQLNTTNQIQWNTSRRINRPSSRALNPFVTFSDPLNIRVGNPLLNPELTWNFEINYLKDFKTSTLTAGVYYRYVDDKFGRLRLINEEGVAVSTFENFATEHSVGMEFFWIHSFTKWWRGNWSINMYRNQVIADNINENYNVTIFGAFGRVAQTLTLPKDFSFQANGFFSPGRRTVQGRFKSFYVLNLALQKEIWDKKGSLSLRLDDVFQSRRFRIITEEPEFVLDSEFFRQTRSLIFTFTYRFNNYKEKRRGGRGSDGGGDFDDF
ncbi:MAG: TonB-dependent receptor [Bernardetiaceae bacterium]|nr:TonB-dependent receptor [Bernardetiaceae bacterium]